MQITEEADRAPIRTQRNQNMRSRRLGQAHRLNRLSVLIDRLEVAAIELEILSILARQHRIRLRSGSDQNGSRRQNHSLACCDQTVACWIVLQLLAAQRRCTAP